MSGAFSELFLFTLSGPAVGSFTATSVVISLQRRPLYDVCELNLAVYGSGADAIAGTADDALLAAAPAVGTQVKLADLPLGAGNYALLLAGLCAVVFVSRRRERADGTAGAQVNA